MDLYKKTLKPKNTKGKAVALVCLISGVLLFFMSSLEFILYPSLIQLTAFLFLTAAVYIAYAYLLREYTYSIERNKNESETRAKNYDFLINETKGKRLVKVCHFQMSDITGVRAVNNENKKQVEAERKNMKRFTYNTEFAPIKRIEICAELDGEKFSIFVAFDEELLKVLSEFTDNTVN